MTKYGRPLRFGCCLDASVADAKQLLQLAKLAETLDLDYLAIQDEPKDGAQYDVWTLATAIGMVASRISVFPIFSEVPMRTPALLAKAAASLDRLTDGRIEIGLSAGATDLEESIQAMREAWHDDASGPAPAHNIKVWLAGSDPDTLSLAGRLADGWIADIDPNVPPGDLARLSTQIDEAAAADGRDPSAIQRIWCIGGRIGSEASQTRFQGNAKQWGESLTELATEAGIDTILLIAGENAEDQLRRFAQEVAPHASGLALAAQGAQASGLTPAEEASGSFDKVDEESMESFPASDPPGSGAIA